MATTISLQSIIGSVIAATAFRYDVKDSLGAGMDTLKIIQNPAGGYLGVYHTGNGVKLATSSDLLNWTFRRTLDAQASQPTIHALPTGGFLTAVEFNNQAGFGRPSALAALSRRFRRCWRARSTGSVTIARTLSACNEGTPAHLSRRR